MSYLRTPVYVWADDRHVHLWPREQDEAYGAYVRSCGFPAGVAVPNDVWDALCLMRAAEIAAERTDTRRYARRLMARYGGNFGSGALSRSLGITPAWARPPDTAPGTAGAGDGG